MSITDRYIRIALKDLPTNKSDYEKIKDLKNFLKGKTKNKPDTRLIGLENVELFIRITDNGLEVFDNDTGEHAHIDCRKSHELSQIDESNYLDVALVKTILEERPNMNFSDYIEEIKNNIKISDEIVNHSWLKIFRVARETMSTLIVQDGHLTQDAVETIIINDMFNRFVKEVVPVAIADFDRTLKEGIIDEKIEEILGSEASRVHLNGGSCLKDEISSKIVPIILSGLLTKYKDEEKKVQVGQCIYKKLNTRKGKITPIEAARSFAMQPGLSETIEEAVVTEIENSNEKSQRRRNNYTFRRNITW